MFRVMSIFGESIISDVFAQKIYQSIHLERVSQRVHIEGGRVWIIQQYGMN